jgi:hypothetical protein
MDRTEMSVDFPLPERPTIAVDEPAENEHVTPARAWI